MQSPMPADAQTVTVKSSWSTVDPRHMIVCTRMRMCYRLPSCGWPLVRRHTYPDTVVTMASKFAQIFLFGDSLTQYSFSPQEGGWGASIADHFQRRADVINRGFSGYNTEWAKLILPQLLSSQDQADVVVIFFGANDASLREINPKQNVPLSNFKSNLVDMCTYLNSIGISSSSLILITPPDLCDSKWEATCKECGYCDIGDRISANTQRYAQAVLDIGRERGIATLDLFDELSKKANLEEYLSDGLHFSIQANKVLADLAIPALEVILQERFPGRLFPPWKEVDNSNLAQSLRLTA